MAEAKTVSESRNGRSSRGRRTPSSGRQPAAAGGPGQAEALACFQTALSRQPDLAEAQYNRGLALENLARFDEALASYDAALTLRSDYPAVLVRKAPLLKSATPVAYDRGGLSCYEHLVALVPDSGELEFLDRAGLLLALGRPTDALASLDKALTLSPGSAMFHFTRGNALFNLGRLADALQSYDRALAIDPGLAEAHSNKGSALARLERLDEAMSSVLSALRINPGMAGALTNQATLLLDQGQSSRGGLRLCAGAREQSR